MTMIDEHPAAVPVTDTRAFERLKEAHPEEFAELLAEELLKEN